MTSFINTKNGFIYITHWLDENVLRLSTRMKVDKKQWNSKKQRPKNKSLHYNGINVNSELGRLENAMNEAVNYLHINNQLSKSNLKLKYLELIGKAPKTRFIEYHFLSYFKEVTDVSFIQNKSNYATLNNSFQLLKSYFKKKKPGFEEINMGFYESYNSWLKNRKALNRNGTETDRFLSANYISIQWKNIKAVMNKAAMEGLHKNEDYKRFVRRNGSSEKVYLNLDELDCIKNLTLKGLEEIVCDWFLIGAFTGLRYSDWSKVNLHTETDGVMSISTTKTKTVARIPIHPIVKQLKCKYKDNLPALPPIQTVNAVIKQIAKKAGIDTMIDVEELRGGELTHRKIPKYRLIASHTARRSLATNLLKSGSAPVDIMKITGHKTLASFERYIRISEQESIGRLKKSAFFQGD
ncbi:phage integrase SAM-like domain-containing protein [Carboxylicivirga taeanensis]|uniref:phage integrase SAM-like domain-containing protein n=1 Tax=Carboxylicivirga taeanensis TaxID=1416875 RepID=UPI003F6DE50B